ncbi:L-threonylcarbamoyladenylate synthase [Methylomarinovum tepidoasis]|uniref:Threonylcarbamoyl-AMP synthase n=1 Tax=Methylomarinovum tepidoasis TaxID=2840183 RepID=A0AAU9C0Z2_9GAMM|nr:Sua5/YciO/YrdC/YwlC family protein [Methylomarinovum sp. IN45]BCX89765.1 L-threonylcarbamoyladenylate synthase [Methylomarinovum sp. IN45]
MILFRWRLRLIVGHLRRGGVIAYPTEGVYGLGCDPWNQAAVETVLALKGRPADKGLILIAADIEQLLPFVHLPSETVVERLLETWPGPVTWILPASPLAPEWLRGKRPTLACRVTAHPVAAQLCRAFGGPLVSTSANPAGHRPARCLLEVRRYFRGRPELLPVPGPLGGLERPTPIFDALTGRCLRP